MANIVKNKKIRLQIIACNASPGPALNAVLGQNGISPGVFIKEFNAKTAAMSKISSIDGCVMRVEVRIDIPGKFDPNCMIITNPVTSLEIKKKLSSDGALSFKDAYKIAHCLAPYMNGRKRDQSAIDGAFRCVHGTARSMNVTVLSKSE